MADVTDCVLISRSGDELLLRAIGRVIAHLAAGGEMAILLVEQYFDFARELAHRIAVMDRGEIVIDDAADRLNPEVVKRHIAV